MSIPRGEHPRPQFYRPDWENLNGEWQFEIDSGRSGKARGFAQSPALSGKIVVPFCPESSLSGVSHKDFMAAVWYKRTLCVPEEKTGMRTLLHFGAVDYHAEVFVNGALAGTHDGGYVSFTLDITAFVKPGENLLTVHAQDDVRSGRQPRGKQSSEYHSHGCDYTRTTGIWQTVWVEWVPKTYIQKAKLTPDAKNGRVFIEAQVAGDTKGFALAARAVYKGKDCGSARAELAGPTVRLELAVSEKHLWNVGEPNLYDLALSLEQDGKEADALASYFGLRDIAFDGMKFLINGRPVFMRLVLDQGFYPDGVCTAPSDQALKNDILLSMAMGFNGARLHQKVFEARFLYHADHLGYLCWGEMGNWGLDHTDIVALPIFLKEWLQAVERDFSAPSIIGWCPFNETWDLHGRPQEDDVLRTVYRVTKAVDPTRPVIDTSGNFHVETDIHDVHDYEQNPEAFSALYGPGTEPIHERFPKRQRYMGQPVFVSEYGGIWWSDTDEAGWGYGQRPKSREEVMDRLKGLTDALLDNPDHCGLCYTQLTDVEQEQNGLYTFDRQPKFDQKAVHAIFARRAAMEEPPSAGAPQEH